jgi:beta-glucosidase
LISDWDGIDYLTPDYHEAVKLSVNAGIDMFMVSEKWKDFIGSLKVHVQNGDVPMERIDDSVRRILYVKVKYGLFEKASPAKRKYSGSKSFGSKEHREVARESVRKSLVLLKNQNEILPLKKSARILVAGKNADNCGFQCGGFTVAWQGISDHEDDKANIVADNLVESIYGNSARPGIGKIEGGTSIWQGISKLAPNAVLNENGNLADPKKHDFAVIVIGEKPYAEGMGDIRKNDDAVGETIGKIQGQLKVLQSYGQSLNLSQLHPEDLEVIKKVTDKGIPAVIVLVSGRPLIIDKEIEKADAFVAAWLPGSEGQGVADVLFGDYNFQGKLSFTWPKNESYYDTDKSDQNLVKFPYGYGLQY